MAGKRSVASASLSSNYRSASTKFSSTSKSSKISSNKTSGSGKLNSGTSKSSSVSRASTARADLTAPIESKHQSPVNWNRTSSATTSASVSSGTASTGIAGSSASNTSIGSTSAAATVSISGGVTVVNNESGSVVKKAAASENTVSVPRGEVHVSTAAKDIAPTVKPIQSDVHKGVGQLKDVQTLNKNQWLDTGTKSGAVTSDAERAAQVSARLEKQSASRRYHPVFTGESCYSITSNDKKKHGGAGGRYGVKFSKMKKMIPKHVKNGTVVSFLDKLSKQFPVSAAVQAKNKKYNLQAIKDMKDNKTYTDGEVINNQSEWWNIKFGAGLKSDMAYSGCEIIATYNALVVMGENMTGTKLVDMISYFEKHGAVLLGDFGTSPTAVYEYMDKKYQNKSTVNVEMYVPEKKKLPDEKVDEIGANGKVFIATVYNDGEDITKQIHTVCISKEKDGSYKVYNTGGGEKNDSKTLSDAIDGISNYSQLISLISIEEIEYGDYPDMGWADYTA